MDIFLVRHAKSDYDWERWPSDEVRPLSKKGRKRQKLVAQGMKKLGIDFDEIWCSPYQRARETLEIIQEYVSPNIQPRFLSELVVWGDPSNVVKMIRKRFEQDPDLRLLLVGHNPNMSSVLQVLSGEHIEMRTSDLAWLRMSGEDIELVKFYERSELMEN
jgi:phosphohistidine phosphatase